MNRVFKIIVAIISIILCGCSQGSVNNDVNVQKDKQKAEEIPRESADFAASRIVSQGEYDSMMSLEQLAQEASYIFEGVCLSKKDMLERGSDLTIQIKRALSGGFQKDEIITVRSYSGEEIKEGDVCLFFTEAWASLYEKMDRFYLDCVTINQKGLSLNKELFDPKGLTYNEIIKLTSAIVDNPGFQAKMDVNSAYCLSDDPLELYDFATNVLTGRIDGIVSDNIFDRTCYEISVTGTRKGEELKTIKLVAFKDSLKVGEEYLFMLLGAEGSQVYQLAGVNAVFPPDYEIK